MLKESPFIPNAKADALIIAGNADEEIINNLKKFNIEIIPTVKCSDVYDEIAFHPDVVIHPINRHTLVVAPNVYEYYEEIFKNKPIKLIKGEKKLNRNYPDDIAYNVARTARYAIHNLEYMDEKLKYYLQKEGVQFINANQGYSKCSTAIIDDNAIITSDPSIYRTCLELDIDILYIESGFIKLPGFDYGFIGGATGAISNNEILFTGKYDNHPNSKDINIFLNKYGKKAIIISNKKIIDIGSIIPLEYN
ncbi:hypothetical protein BET03_10610 [Thermohalobacter berrensis]|uniref:DUF6873 domain-containing protein n=2 Tax=Thermohalobacter berrensis TaxID=99594 RepID=A0A419T4Z6_9FIRM|nr:hypothetical protein BET03_10610 [Thermohalobacter berrensis]